MAKHVNYFLLTHKCGNTYMRKVHKSLPDVPLTSILGSELDHLDALPDSDQRHNVRCRNLDAGCLDALEAASPTARYALFTRDPASFVLSATDYHMRGGEAWAREVPQPHLGGATLTAALNAADTKTDAHIITMTQFRPLYEKQVSWLTRLPAARAIPIRCEDAFKSRSPFFPRLSPSSSA